MSILHICYLCVCKNFGGALMAIGMPAPRPRPLREALLPDATGIDKYDAAVEAVVVAVALVVLPPAASGCSPAPPVAAAAEEVLVVALGPAMALGGRMRFFKVVGKLKDPITEATSIA